jgi:hypothetical protein
LPIPTPLIHCRNLCLASWLLFTGCSESGKGKQEPSQDAGPSGDAGLSSDAGRMRDDAATPDADTPDGGLAAPPIFGVWRELRERARQSAEHLPARAEALVAARDVEGLFELVRDRVVIHPRSRRGNTAAWGATRIWGARGALRSGLATPREKVELLRDLLQRAGFSAEVVVGTPLEERQQVLALYHQAAPAPASIPVTAEDRARWATALGGALPVSRARAVDADNAEASALAVAISSLVEPPTEPLETDLEIPGSMPLVRFERDGATVYANPLFPDAVLGESYTRANPVRADGARLEEVEVRFWARRNHGATGEDVELCTLSTTADVLAGRRLVVRTAPVLPLDALLRARPDDVRAFVPAIELEGSDVDEPLKQATSVAGRPFNLEADRLEVSAGGEVLVEGVPLATVANQQAAIDAVSTLEVTVNAARFDDVTVHLDALDAQGEPVEGLSVGAFHLEEEGVRMGASLRRNQSRLRVLFVFDASTSVPEAFRGEGLVALARDLATDLFDDPLAELSVMAMSSETANPFTRDVDEVERQVRETTGGTSSVWQGLASAASRNADLVLFLSDLKATDALTDARRAAMIRGAAPTLILGVGSVDDSVASQAASLTGGSVETIADAAAARSAAAAFTDRRKASYELSYRAPADGASTRTVRVSLARGEVAGEASYSVPAADAQGGARGFTGLYLTVRIGTRSVTRTLAGADPRAVARAEDVQATRDALFGTATLVFEPGPVPFPVVLDEWLSERVGWQALLEASRSYEEFVAALQRGVPRTLPARFLLAGAPAYDRAASLTYDTHLRTMLIVQQPRFGEGRQERIDLLPFAELATTGEDATLAWQQTLSRSLHWAALESALGTSTAGLLASETLVAVAAEDADSLFAAPELAARWARATSALDDDYTLLVPSGGEPVAFWSIYEPSGSVLGVLEDGSGGVQNAITSRVERNLAFFDMLESLASTGVVTGGAWLDLELAKARAVSYATLWVATVGDGFPDVPEGISPEDMAEDFVEGQVEDALLDLLPGNLGEVVGEAQDWLGVVSAVAGD